MAKTLRDPLGGHDLPVGNHWLKVYYQIPLKRIFIPSTINLATTSPLRIKKITKISKNFLHASWSSVTVNPLPQSSNEIEGDFAEHKHAKSKKQRDFREPRYLRWHPSLWTVKVIWQRRNRRKPLAPTSFLPSRSSSERRGTVRFIRSNDSPPAGEACASGRRILVEKRDTFWS